MQTPLTRRSFLFAAAGLLLAGCGDDDSSDDAAPAASGAFPVRIDGVLGPVTIESEPKRVVAVGDYRDIDAAVALGLVPVGAPDLSAFIPGGRSPWVQRGLAGATAPELFATADGLPFEQIAALQPDLILATDRNGLENDYSLLSGIAPTISTANGYNKDTWQVTTERVGRALGRSDQAAQLVSDVQARIASVRSANPDFAGRTFTFGPVLGDGNITTINSDADASVVFFSQLGFQLAPAVKALPTGNIPGRAPVSPERLDVLDADVLILAYSSPAARSRIEEQELFTRIPAVARGSYVGLELTDAIALGFPSVLSIGYALDKLTPLLQSAVTAK